MKKEKVAFDNISARTTASAAIRGLTMSVNETDRYGILFDRIEERDAVISILSGGADIFEGEVRFDKIPLKEQEYEREFSKKVDIIQRKSKLIQNLSLAENIYLFSERGGFINRRYYDDMMRKLTGEMSVDMPPDRKVKDLAEKDRIIVELLKFYEENKDIIVLSHFSSFLGSPDQDEINSLIERMREVRPITVIIIDSLCDLIFKRTDRVLIIKNNTSLGCFKTDFISKSKLQKYLMDNKGTRLSRPDDNSRDDVSDDEAVSFEGLSTRELTALSFHAMCGEALNIFCPDRRSIEGIKKVFYGNADILSGSIRIAGRKISVKNTSGMYRNRIGYLKERAYKSMLIPEMSVRDNILLDLSHKKLGLWVGKKYKNSVDRQINEWMNSDICSEKVSSLTARERQNLAFLKLYLAAPRVLICERPFFDADLHMKEIAKSWIDRFRERGAAVIILTMSIQDLMEVEGDVLYLMDGEMVEEDDIYQMIYKA